MQPDSSTDLVIDTPFDSALSERYLVYALSTITARSLPDVRDGLKPVHRRLLWAMRLLRLDPASAYKKCARVVGDVIGKYHPHGDQSVYDAMVRLAQSFSLRYPLVDGQGNFGNIDGDNAAAYRYTEARLTRSAIELMAGLDEGSVDYRPTQQDSRKAEKELKNLEKRIAKLDSDKRELNDKLMTETNAKEAVKYHEELAKVVEELATAEERWLELSQF